MEKKIKEEYLVRLLTVVSSIYDSSGTIGIERHTGGLDKSNKEILNKALYMYHHSGTREIESYIQWLNKDDRILLNVILDIYNLKGIAGLKKYSQNLNSLDKNRPYISEIIKQIEKREKDKKNLIFNNNFKSELLPILTNLKIHKKGLEKIVK